MTVLALLFGLTAALYAAVGFGGGSTYNALLALWGVDYRILPAIALLCNIIVVTGGSIRFARAGLVPWRRLWPILMLSAPLAWLGGRTPISESLFTGLLGLSLLIAGLLLLFQPERRDDLPDSQSRIVTPLIGAGVGLLSGLVGIGGGIFLAPVMHLIGWARAKRIAACASVFILVNSIAGLAGQIMKIADPVLEAELLSYWPLGLAVLIGGQLGSIIGIRLLPASLVRRVTAVLILYVAVRMLAKWAGWF
ncbi:sulfite exporter TauE/SafE family protein [Sphingobium algorifonticola]|uniref:Probable membrane transporter protein n=1 Tax=Sphingobium algorifonticola TaxID=2008318 RepID=A0A437J6N1_9SPHN|nr:sulfite exporter TauE/SafE family protein [Sphingobium algorifonticola]RVT40842.1 sulfite exporter TauE/SafE family protein [Sphingobium algorifonticola]